MRLGTENLKANFQVATTILSTLLVEQFLRFATIEDWPNVKEEVEHGAQELEIYRSNTKDVACEAT
ncbi:MAG TPA: hypothetical protein DDZ51_14680 [Planctomycetaceae bacterium]|nr:hypothetical protein [Planctomycetaceae bacterium]